MPREFPSSIESNSNFSFFFLILYTIALFVRPHEWNPANLYDPTPYARYFLMAAFAGYLIFQKPKVWGLQGWFLTGVLIVIFLSGVRNGWLGGGINQAQNFFIYALLPFALYSGLINTAKKQYWIFIVLAITCAIMIHHGISQHLSQVGMGWTGQYSIYGRITYLGFFNDPNDLGMFFVMNIPILYYLKTVTKNPIAKFMFFLLTLGLIYGIYLTNSRGALLGLMSLGMTYCYFQYGKIKTALLGLLCLPIVYVVMTFFREIDAEEASAYGRVEAWAAGMEMFKMRPLFGVGKSAFMDYHDLTAHNSYVLVMAELGSLGYLLWFGTIGLTLLMLIKVFSLAKERFAESPEVLNDILLAKCLFFSFVGFLSTAFFLSRSYVVFLYIFLGLACAVFYRVLKKVPEVEEIVNTQVIVRLFMLAFASLIGLYFIVKILI